MVVELWIVDMKLFRYGLTPGSIYLNFFYCYMTLSEIDVIEVKMTLGKSQDKFECFLSRKVILINVNIKVNNAHLIKKKAFYFPISILFYEIATKKYSSQFQT